MFAVPLQGGDPERLPIGYAVRIDMDPKTGLSAFTRSTNENATWKRYRGGTAPDIWVGDPARADFHKVTDFDGTELSEKELAAKYGVRFTPTFQFFPERAAPLKALEPVKREVTRAPGYMRPDDFLAMFRYVREKAYESKSFRDFVKALPS
jgi:hypothetical protein